MGMVMGQRGPSLMSWQVGMQGASTQRMHLPSCGQTRSSGVRPAGTRRMALPLSAWHMQ